MCVGGLLLLFSSLFITAAVGNYFTRECSRSVGASVCVRSEMQDRLTTVASGATVTLPAAILNMPGEHSTLQHKKK